MNFERLKADPRMPKHIAFIMDGNGRWAKHRGLPRSLGHKAGADTLRKIVEDVKSLGINTLSLYCFSSENWNRPNEEVNYLMNLFESMLDEYKDKYLNQDVRIMISGNMDDERLPLAVKQKAKSLIEQTKNKTAFTINFCINYGGRQEILRAVNSIILNNEQKIDDCVFEKYLYTKDLIPLDFVIRTSGEYRSSNFMVWQSAYSEWYYPKVHWPSFTKKHLIKALKIYMKRNRRFGSIKG